MILMKEAKTKSNIKRGKMGEREKKERKGERDYGHS